LIALKDVTFSYKGRRALDRVSLEIDKGEHVALIGPNASGKTTLAMIMNALLLPDSGDCIVDGVHTRDDAMHARKAVGLVFQDPESQAVARHVRDDVAFGPMNLGLLSGEVEERVFESLGAVGMESLVDREVSGLSGGQKQLLAIAGVLAMRPSYVVLDEPTSLLDGRGTTAVDGAIGNLKIVGTGVVVITHDMAEALRADRVIVLDEGRIIADAPPSVVFSDRALLEGIGVEPPYAFKLVQALGRDILTGEVSHICR
jgi:energy-coupling factor transporter ATP-binding protein EcfA2